jgi:hypothetical protein
MLCVLSPLGAECRLSALRTLSCCQLCVSSLCERRLFDDLEFLCTNCQTAVDSVASRSPKEFNASPNSLFIKRKILHVLSVKTS